MRAPTACLACRNRRRKCDIPSLNSPCTYCSSRRINCIGGHYSASAALKAKRDGSAGHSTVSPSSPSAPPSPTLIISRGETNGRPRVGSVTKIPSLELCMELLSLYFDFIHDQFHSLFHRPSLEEDVLAGRAPAIVLFGIMALSARFSYGETRFSTNSAFAGVDPKERSTGYIRECANMLDLEDISLTTIRACVLMGTISIIEGKGAAESVYYCVASRLALLMDLANRPTVDAIEAEVNKRVWWTLYMIDTWSSTGMRLPKIMPHLDGLSLPIDEGTFLLARSDNDLGLNFDLASQNTDSSLLAQMIKLNYILVEINELNKLTVDSEGVVYEDRIEVLSQNLDRWYNDLPHTMHDTPENLAYWASQGLGRIFVAVYLGYYHFGQLLFYQFLHEDYHQNIPQARSHAQKCKDHSRKLCAITYAASSTPGCEVLYTMVGHVLVIASTVQIHTLLFGDDDAQIRDARARLERNFEILTRLRQYWPTLEASFSRLRAFHKACQRFMNSSFRLDQWMLTFLSEFAKPVDDKYTDRVEPEWIVDNLGISPQS